jgi:hypothetical protein
MLKLPPPIWALVYVFTAAVISWFFDWSKVPGFPLPPLGILLVAISWILPVWAFVLFRREGTEIEPTSPTNRKLITSGPSFDPKRTFTGRGIRLLRLRQINAEYGNHR